MKYFKGDIVEIITSDYGSLKEFKESTDNRSGSFYNSYDQPYPIRGQRFRVHTDQYLHQELLRQSSGEYKYVDCGYVYAFFEGKECYHINIERIMLVKRSAYNWIRYIFTTNKKEAKNKHKL